MGNDKWIFTLIIIQTIIVHNTATIRNHPKAFKLVTTEKDNKLEVDYMLSSEDKCKYKCTISYIPHSNHNGPRPRFIDLGTNTSVDDSQMEPPSPKFSFLNLLTGDGETDDDNDIYEYGSGENVKEEDDPNDEDNDDGGIDFFGYDEDEEEDENNSKDGDNDGPLKQYHRRRHRFRMHNVVFPLLLAYKLKFFTVIPLLLGSLVLLVGTTGIAGFFFALFAAALGIHVKSHNEHF